MNANNSIHEPPESVTKIWVNFCGLVCGLLTAIYIFRIGLAVEQKAVVIIFSTVVPILFLNIFVYNVYSRASTGLNWGHVNSFCLARICVKLFGLVVILAAITTFYILLPEYSHAFYQPFWSIAKFYSPILVIGAGAYFVCIDRYLCEPHDDYWLFGQLCLGKVYAGSRAQLVEFIRGWVIKGFFLPLMFSGLVVLLQTLASFVTENSFNSVELMQVFALSWMLLFCIDLVFVTAGYIFTLRLLDSHIRSTESAIIGWVAAILCYRPFWDFIQSNFLNYNADGLNWNAWLTDYSLIQGVWAVGIITLLVIYTWSTITFGLCFSNLTNRGILTNGPYRYTKHPAYIAKNLSWWMVAVPFISNQSWMDAVSACLLLLCVNAIYVIRAKSEERHLSNDLNYLAYSNWIENNGLPYKVRVTLFKITHSFGFNNQPSDKRFRDSCLRVRNSNFIR